MKIVQHVKIVLYVINMWKLSMLIFIIDQLDKY